MSPIFYHLGFAMKLWARFFDCGDRRCLASCSLDNPVGRSLVWFSYLDGADIRDACAERSGSAIA